MTFAKRAPARKTRVPGAVTRETTLPGAGRHRRLAAGAAVIALTIAAGLPDRAHATVLTDCYSFKAGKKDVNMTGDQLRLALNAAVRTAMQPPANARVFAKVAAVPNAKRCEVPKDAKTKQPLFQMHPDMANARTLADGTWYGEFTSLRHFNTFAAIDCGTVAQNQPVNRFFSIGGAVYYRQCPLGQSDDKGYVFFWGDKDGKASDCQRYDYPSMYAGAKGATIDDYVAVAKNGNIGTANARGYALGNLMAAVLVAETMRDYNLAFLNSMLLELGKKNDWKLDTLFGGHCPKGSSTNTCANRSADRDGRHPLAWGGAKESMMLTNWGGAQGANSDFGQEFETQIIVDWLTAFQSAGKAKACLTANAQANENVAGRPSFEAVRELFGKRYAPGG
jgi:hypothetical protein